MFSARFAFAFALLSVLVLSCKAEEEESFDTFHEVAKRQNAVVQRLMQQLTEMFKVMQQQMLLAIAQGRRRVMRQIIGIKRCQYSLAAALNKTGGVCRRM